MLAYRTRNDAPADALEAAGQQITFRPEANGALILGTRNQTIQRFKDIFRSLPPGHAQCNSAAAALRRVIADTPSSTTDHGAGPLWDDLRAQVAAGQSGRPARMDVADMLGKIDALANRLAEGAGGRTSQAQPRHTGWQLQPRGSACHGDVAA